MRVFRVILFLIALGAFVAYFSLIKKGQDYRDAQRTMFPQEWLSLPRVSCEGGSWEPGLLFAKNFVDSYQSGVISGDCSGQGFAAADIFFRGTSNRKIEKTSGRGLRIASEDANGNASDFPVAILRGDFLNGKTVAVTWTFTYPTSFKTPHELNGPDFLCRLFSLSREMVSLRFVEGGLHVFLQGRKFGHPIHFREPIAGGQHVIKLEMKLEPDGPVNFNIDNSVPLKLELNGGLSAPAVLVVGPGGNAVNSNKDIDFPSFDALEVRQL